eukprot:3569053-Amphidinium_carterae.1
MPTVRHLLDECWYEYGPERVACFDDIYDMSDIEKWLRGPVLDMEPVDSTRSTLHQVSMCGSFYLFAT